MHLILLLALLVPIDTYAKDHITQSLCDEVAETINNPEFAHILSQQTKDHLLKNCYGHTNGETTKAND